MNTDFDFEFDNEIVDDFGEMPTEKAAEKKAAVRPIHDEWNIVKAFNAINAHAPKSQLKGELFVRCAEAFRYLANTMGLSAVQCVIIAMLIEHGKPLALRQMGKGLGLSYLSMMTYHEDIEGLFSNRWINHRNIFERGERYEAYALAKGVVEAVRENRPFEAEKLECADSQAFVEKLALHFKRGIQGCSNTVEDEVYWVEELLKANESFPLCRAAQRLDGNYSRTLLMLLVADHINFNGMEEEGLNMDDVDELYTETGFFEKEMLKSGRHALFTEGFAEHKCEDGMCNTNIFRVSAYVKNELLADVAIGDHSSKTLPQMNGVKAAKDIVPKSLFYNESERSQIERLANILSAEQLPIIQERLRQKGMRTGVCILMHGYPGTGKTATAYEIARQTGRDIIQVQVTDFKDKYVGESEANLKRIFANYRRYCQNSEVAPILLLNEGDAILSKRTQNVERSVDQMSNALQNILLEEMENLEGIMIVTTNLTVNLDKAFERRFIFKIQFEKPSVEVKARIWQSMIDHLAADDATELARLYDVTGGEIENIARKSTMEYVLTGREADVEMLKAFTQQEKLESSQKRKAIGFM